MGGQLMVNRQPVISRSPLDRQSWQSVSRQITIEGPSGPERFRTFRSLLSLRFRFLLSRLRLSPRICSNCQTPTVAVTRI